MDANTLGQRIRALREARGWSQQDVEARGGPLQGVVSKIEKGQNDPSLKSLKQLAHAFGLGVADLLRESPDPSVTLVAAVPPVTEAMRGRWKAALARAFDPSAHDLDDVAELRQMPLSDAFDEFTDAELVEVCRAMLTALTDARRRGKIPTATALMAELVRRLISHTTTSAPPFIRVPTPPGATPAVRPKAVTPAAREIFEAPHHGATPVPLPEGKAKRASVTKPK